MTWGMVAVAGATLVTGAIASDSARKASNQQADASQAAISAQTSQADRSYADYAPYRAAGVNALGQLAGEINMPTTAADVMSDPGYQFGMQQGQIGLDRKASAMGGRVSGEALKRASMFATDYATTGYGAAYQRRQDRLNRLASLAGIGQTATGGSAQAGAAAAGNISGLISSQGNAAAASQLAQGNIWGNTINQLGAVGQRWANQPNGGAGTVQPGNYSGTQAPAPVENIYPG